LNGRARRTAEFVLRSLGSSLAFAVSRKKISTLRPDNVSAPAIRCGRCSRKSATKCSPRSSARRMNAKTAKLAKNNRVCSAVFAIFAFLG